MIKTRADLFEAAAKMMRMCDDAGIEYVHKYENKYSRDIVFVLGDVAKYEFPLSIVEGKPVFVGDELYCKDGLKHEIIRITEEEGYLIDSKKSFFTEDYLSWNPPKPRTVMVELLLEDAEAYANLYGDLGAIIVACRKALANDKK